MNLRTTCVIRCMSKIGATVKPAEALDKSYPTAQAAKIALETYLSVSQDDYQYTIIPVFTR